MTPEDFERVLDRACHILTENVRTNADYHSPDAFERHALDMLKVAAHDCDLTVQPSFHKHAFPDIRANGYGVEVKYTQQDTWQAVGNSIFEGMRDPGVDTIYVLFGKIGGLSEVRWARYEECVTHVRVSNSPRFVVELETDRASLFEHMAIGYDEFAKLDDGDKMRHVREYSRQRLQEGERLWWLEPSHSVPVNVRPYMNLPKTTRRRLRAEAAILCPRICAGGRDRGKYVDVALYLLMHHGVVAPQTRDLFTAGSVALRADGRRGGKYILRSLLDIEDLMKDVAKCLDDALIEEYWGKKCAPRDRIAEWLRMADTVAKDWKPSEHLFLG